MASRWKSYASGLADKSRGFYVSVDYQTNAGSPGTWARWTEADNIKEAQEAANAHVRGFKRVGRIYGGSAFAYQGTR